MEEAERVAEAITNKKLPENKYLLLFRYEEEYGVISNSIVAEQLILFTPEWYTDDKDILLQKIISGREEESFEQYFAHFQAYFYSDNNWTPKDKEILNLKDEFGTTVKEVLEQESEDLEEEEEDW